MTFDELMDKYLPLIENASVDDLGQALLELKPEDDTRFKRLVVALEQDLAGSLEGPNLRKGAIMAAKELINRLQFPEGGGATGEGAFAGPCYSEVDGLDPNEAAEPAPPPVVVEMFDERLDVAIDRVKSDPGPKWYVETTSVAKQVPKRKP
jgi:hypothetical protein